MEGPELFEKDKRYPMNLQLFADKSDEDEPETDDGEGEDDKPTKKAVKPAKKQTGEEIPEWAKNLQSSMEKLSKLLGSADSPVSGKTEPQKLKVPPIKEPKSENDQEPPKSESSTEPKNPPDKGKSLLRWFLG